MRTVMTTVFTVLSLIALSAVPAVAAMSLKAGHTLAPAHPYHLGLLKFAELIKERTGGEVTIDVFHSSQLGSERELIESLQMGTADITVISTAPLAGFTKSFMVFNLPYIFSDRDAAHKVLDGNIGRAAFDSLEKIGLIGLAYFENGFRQLTSAKKPIIKPEDVKGLTIRTMENKIHLAAFKALGANPVPLPYNEVYKAIEQGVTEAQENPLPIIFHSKLYEIQKYCSLTNHFYSPAPLLISKKIWGRLSPEQQIIFREAALEARDYQRLETAKQNGQFLDELKAKGMHVNEVDQSLWRAAMEPVYQQFEAEIGADIIKTVR